MIGTWLGRECWGTGANRESKALIAHLGFRLLGLERIGAYADLDNARSQRALDEARLRAARACCGAGTATASEVHDVLVYSWLLRGVGEHAAVGDVPVRVERSAAAAVLVGDRPAQERRCSQLKPRTASAIPSTAQAAITPSELMLSAERCALDHRARKTVDQVLERERLSDALQESRGPWPRRRTRPR